MAVLHEKMQQVLIKSFLSEADLPLIVCRPSPFSIIYINDTLEQAWGFHAHALLKEPERITAVIYEEDRSAFIKKVINNPHSHCNEAIEFRIVMPHDRLRWYALRLHHLPLPQQGQWVVGYVEDITERKEQETMLQQTCDKLEDFVQMLKHDMKGMMGNIQIVANLIKEKISTKEQEELASYFDLISLTCREAVSHTEEITERFLLETDHLLIEKEQVNLAEEVFQAVDLYRAQLEAKRLTTKVLLSEGKMIVQADKLKCWQIIKNLLSNAIKFSQNEGQIIIALKELKDAILLKVSDMGIGIPKALQPFIFQKHSQAIRRGTKGEIPTGMGTYIVKKIVKAHNGEVWFESKEEEGTTFFVKLPR